MEGGPWNDRIGGIGMNIDESGGYMLTGSSDIECIIREKFVFSRTRLLFVHEDKDVRRHFCEILQDEELSVQAVPHGWEALECFKNFPADIVMLCTGGGGLKSFEESQAHFPGAVTVAVVDGSVPEGAVAAMDLGSCYHLSAPLDPVAVQSLIRKINDWRRSELSLSGEVKRRQRYRFENLIGQDPKMVEIYHEIDGLSASDATVLITGETGTGKELVAEAIHFRSQRKVGPLVRVNCAAFTETLINSELFGHEKGAFSGAVALRKGCFELAHRGTVFLDEIGDISAATQIALLRVLDSGSFRRVGGVRTINVDTRIICATNKDLLKEVTKRLFREDLFYRIHCVPMHIPPLRERKSDISLIAAFFLRRYAVRAGKEIATISAPAMEMLCQYDWPGNVRELAHVMERVVIFSQKKEVTPDELPRNFREAPPLCPFALTLTSRSLPAAESALIRKVLEESDWNLKRAAEKLDIARGTLYGKIKKYGIQRSVIPPL